MKIFKSNGKDWIINITGGAIEKIMLHTGFDMTKLFGDELNQLNRLFNDPLLLIKVLWCSLSEHTDDDAQRVAFCDAIRGEALELAAKALIEDYIDFFPNRRQQQIWREMVAKLWEIVDQVQDQQAKALASITATSLESAIASVASSESTLAATP